MPLMTANSPLFINSLRGFAVTLTDTPSWVPDHIVPEAIEAGGIVVTQSSDLSETRVETPFVAPPSVRGRSHKSAE